MNKNRFAGPQGDLARSARPRPGWARWMCSCCRLLAASSVPCTVLLTALWIGLVGGFLDLGVFILKQHLARDRFFRLGDHFFWLIPAGDTVLIVVPGLFLAIAGLIWRGAGFLRVAVAMLTF